MDTIGSVMGQVPPNNLEAEKCVLGAMLLSAQALNDAVLVLKEGDFYSPIHRELFKVFLHLYETGTPLDIVTATAQLRQTGMLEGIGGAAYLVELSRFVPSVANLGAYVGIVQDRALLRSLGAIGDEIRGRSFDSSETGESVLEYSEKTIFEIATKREQEDFIHVRLTVGQVFETIQEAYKLKSHVTGVPTGFKDLDRNTSGLQNSDLIVFASRPSMGKTSFMLNVADYVAREVGIPVAFFSLEMSREQLVHRMICTAAGVDQFRVREGRITDEDWIKLSEAMTIVAAAPIYIDDTGGITVSQMRSKLRKLKIEKGIGMILLDYLQLMQGSGQRRSDNRQQEISEISRELKILAREMNVPVFVAAQLSRAPELRASNHRPILSDLRDSGAIEQDADVVMMLYRDEYYHEDTEEKNIAEIIITKQRNGPTGTVKLNYYPQYTRFEDLSRR